MSSSLFDVQVHTVPCQHIRQYPGATFDNQEEVLHLELKQYRPLANLDPKPGDVTIIAAHANGFPKELYEPLWDEILHRAKQNGFNIRGIWITDISHQGASGILNEDKIGDDPSWFDNARDLLHITNLFRDQMPRPLVGIGHSMGGTTLAFLSLMHPRLLSTLILLDPVMTLLSNINPRLSAPQLSAFRRDYWPSRAKAEESFRKSKFYQQWDPRVLELWLEFGLRELPTTLLPLPPNDATNDIGTTPDGGLPTTLRTSKHQEVFTFLRPNFNGIDAVTGERIFDRNTHPDLDPNSPGTYPLYRSEPLMAIQSAQNLRPSVLYIFGETSNLSTPYLREEKMAETGIGVGGSGGAKEGRVAEVTLKGIGHLVAMEAVVDCAEHTATWLGKELKIWKAQEDKFRNEWSRKSREEKTTLSEEWKKALGGDPRLTINAAKAKEKL